MNKHKNRFVFNLTDIITCLLSAYLGTLSLLVVMNSSAGVSVNFADDVNIVVFASVAFLFSLPLIISDGFNKEKNICRYAFLGTLMIFCFALVAKQDNTGTYIIAFFVLLVAFYCFEHKVQPELPHHNFSHKSFLIIVICVSVAAFAVLCTIAVLRYYTYSAPNYDFGLFCNMFYNMKETGRAVSTCERDKLLSHFAVHISPVFYLILPLYYIFPSPLTLAVIQPIIIFSSVIPLYLLCKHFKLSQNCVTFFTAAFALYTPLSSGCFYDLHENCFLVPLLLWVFYFFETDRKIPLAIFTLLVLMVKEDAFIYIAFFSLYIFLSRKKYLTGSVMFAGALVYFVIACTLLTKYGTGVMSSRYSNLSDGGSLIETAKSIIVNPGYAISQVLSTKENNMEKVFYIAEILCPIVFIPFMSKDFTRYILILPIFINLLTQYPYQYDISFQYTFGISVFLFYFSILNLSEMKKEKQEHLSFMSVIASLLLFLMIVVPKCDRYIYKYAENKETYNQITEALEIIPEDAEVTASTYLIAHIADRDVIYEDEYHDTPSTEYFVLDRTREAAEGREKMYLDAGYELIYEIEGVLEIYQNEAYS